MDILKSIGPDYGLQTAIFDCPGMGREWFAAHFLPSRSGRTVEEQFPALPHFFRSQPVLRATAISGHYQQERGTKEYVETPQPSAKIRSLAVAVR
jgi:hypothetical protein